MQTLGADGHHLHLGCLETRFKTMLGAGSLSERDLKKQVLRGGEDKSSNKKNLIKGYVLSWLSL